MRKILGFVLGIVIASPFCPAQTAEELVAKNLDAKGGLQALKAITSLKMVGKFQQGTFTAATEQFQKTPDDLRQTITIQGMTAVQAYDGKTGWQIQPFGGRKDPEMLGEDDLRDFVEQADFYGPLVDSQQKGNRIEYLGKETVDGDDALRLQVTLKNGDILDYYLDPDTFLEIRVEKRMFIRGAVRETVTDLGAYKKVAGVYFPFSSESFPKGNPSSRATVTFDKIEANVPLSDALFTMPSVPATNPPQTHPEPPVPGTKKPAATSKPEPPKKP